MSVHPAISPVSDSYKIDIAAASVGERDQNGGLPTNIVEESSGLRDGEEKKEEEPEEEEEEEK